MYAVLVGRVRHAVSAATYRALTELAWFVMVASDVSVLGTTRGLSVTRLPLTTFQCPQVSTNTIYENDINNSLIKRLYDADMPVYWSNRCT